MFPWETLQAVDSPHTLTPYHIPGKDGSSKHVKAQQKHLWLGALAVWDSATQLLFPGGPIPWSQVPSAAPLTRPPEFCFCFLYRFHFENFMYEFTLFHSVASIFSFLLISKPMACFLYYCYYYTHTDTQTSTLTHTYWIHLVLLIHMYLGLTT